MRLRVSRDAALAALAIAIFIGAHAAVDALDRHDEQIAREKQEAAVQQTYVVAVSEPRDLIVLPVVQEETQVVLEVEEVEEVEPITYYDVPLDHETQELLMQACEESGVSMVLALAVISRETDFRNVSGDNGNSAGYMQIQERWHRDRMERLGVTDLYDPLSNFRVGCDFLAELLERYTVEEALTCYNSGKPGKSNYADNVMDRMEAIREA